MKKNKTKQNMFIKGYKSSYNLLKKSKLHVLIAVSTMLLAITVGFIFPQLFEEQVLKIIQGMLYELEGKNTTELITFIFINNTKASLFGMILGIFLGIFPLITGIINGYVIGFTVNIAINTEGIFILWKLLPHGIFELPAVFLSLGIGLYLGDRFLERFFKIKSEIKRIVIMCFSTIALIPIAGFYYVWSLDIIEVQKIGFSSLSNPTLPLAIAIGIINLALIGGFIFVFVQFLKDKILRKDLMDAIIFFLLITLPLLIIAAIIEGYLIKVVG